MKGVLGNFEKKKKILVNGRKQTVTKKTPQQTPANRMNRHTAREGQCLPWEEKREKTGSSENTARERGAASTPQTRFKPL